MRTKGKCIFGSCAQKIPLNCRGQDLYPTKTLKSRELHCYHSHESSKSATHISVPLRRELGPIIGLQL